VTKGEDVPKSFEIKTLSTSTVIEVRFQIAQILKSSWHLVNLERENNVVLSDH
jgi:hypothetical protein